MVVLLFAQAALPVREVWHQVMELVIFGTTMGAIALWNRHTAGAQEAEVTLRETQRRATARRDIPLTDVQAHYLLAQARHKQDYRQYGSY